MKTGPILSHIRARAVYDRLGRRLVASRFHENPPRAARVAHGEFGSARAVVERGWGSGRLAEDLLSRPRPPAATDTGIAAERSGS